MAFQNMTLEDFARHVGMDARDVQKLADRGKLPAQKVGGRWRFNRAQVTEWLQQEIIGSELGDERLKAIETAMSEAATLDMDRHLVTAMISLDGIDLHLPAKTKSSVLLELVSLADQTGLLWDKPGLLRALQEREALCSTALPNHVAIPHPRQPMPYVSAESFICLARVAKGIGFGSRYGGLTDTFFLICCHDDRSHLHVLARLMRMLDPKTLDQIREIEEREDVLALLIEREEQLTKTASAK